MNILTDAELASIAEANAVLLPALETYRECECDELTATRVTDEDGDFEDASDDFMFAIDAIVDGAECLPRLLASHNAQAARIAELEAELTEHRETILYSEGFLIKDGDKAGWWDSCSSSDAVQAGDALVATGLWERHADGVGRRQFYRRVSA